MQKISKKIIFPISVILLTALIVGFLFIYKQINANHEKAKALNTELENEISNKEELRLLNSSIKTIREESEMLSAHFAKSSDIVPFLDTIEALAMIVDLQVETSAVDILKENAGLVVKINTSGSFKNTYKFLTLLENSPYELEFKKIDIEREPVPLSKEGIPITKESKWNSIFTIKLVSFTP